MLVLIGTVLAIVAPSLRGFVRGRQTANAAADILSLTHMARSRAAARGSVHRLNVDTEAGAYWLTMHRAGAFVPIDGNDGRHHALPVGVSIVVDPPVAGEAITYVGFHPDGRCDQATIQLTGMQGEVLWVACPSASERFRIVSPSEDARP